MLNALIEKESFCSTTLLSRTLLIIFLSIVASRVYLSTADASEVTPQVASQTTPQAATQEKNSPEIVIHLLDYLAKDYAGAVQNGKIINEGEFREQVDFAQTILENSLESQSLKSEDYISNVKKLVELIKSKAPDPEVARLARTLQSQAIERSGTSVAPSTLPDISLGMKTYQKMNCVSCHGKKGQGDGEAGAYLDPKPSNFLDPELASSSSPFQFYNTIRLGVPNTGMAAYPSLSDEEAWSLAYYLKSLPYAGASAPQANELISTVDLARLNDQEIIEKLGTTVKDPAATLAQMRAHGNNGVSKDPLAHAVDLLKQGLAALKENRDYKKAHRLVTAAYLEGIEPVESKIAANLPGSVEKIEGMMLSLRASIKAEKSIDAIESEVDNAIATIHGFQDSLSTSKLSPWLAFIAAFSIFLREGFEALLIIVILLSILKAANQDKAMKWVHIGWSSAVGLGIIFWFLSGLILQFGGFQRELMEGLISILAVVVLIYVGFWLHQHTEAEKWQSYLKKKLKSGLSTKSYISLAFVAFIAVFREAFEVILFLRAIWVDLDTNGQTIAGFGILVSFIILLLLTYIILRKNRKLPISKLFTVSTWIIAFLSIVLAGKGIHSLQEAGIIQASTLPISLRSDFLGIYPFTETLMAQAIVVLVFIFLFWPKNRLNVKKEPS